MNNKIIIFCLCASHVAKLLNTKIFPGKSLMTIMQIFIECDVI